MTHTGKIEYDGTVAVSSGTAEIHLALLEAGVGNGDIVFYSDMTFVASANPILYCRAKPVFLFRLGDYIGKVYGWSE